MDSPYAPDRPALPAKPPSAPAVAKGTAARRELERLKAIVARWKVD